MNKRLSYTLCKFFNPFLLSAALLGASCANAQVSITASAGSPGPTSYPTLSAAFAEVNNGTYQGDVILTITGSFTELATAQINESGSGSANYTSVLIKPGVGVTATISSSLATGPIFLNGASDLTIDGSNAVGGTSRDLTITNTNTANTGFVIRLGTPSAAVACTNVRIKNCILTGAGSSNNRAVIISDAGGATMGATQLAPTNNITIQNNRISNANRGIESDGPAALNTNLTIITNRISNCRIAGIQLTNESDVSVSQDTITDPTIGIQITNGLNGSIGNNTITGFTICGSCTTNTSSNNLTLSGVQLVNGNGMSVKYNRITGPVVLAGGTGNFSNPGGTGTASGINISGGQGITVNNNNITGSSGVKVNQIPTSGIHLSGPLTGADIIANNISNIENASDSGAFGMYVDVNVFGAALNVYNNFISNSRCPAGNSLARMGHGIYISRADGINLFFNSINMSVNQPGAVASSPASAGICFEPASSGAVHADMEDNIIVNTQTTGVAVALYAPAGVGIFTPIDYNSYYASPGSLGYNGVTTVTTIAGMQTVFGGDPNSITVNPSWVSSSDLHLLPIPANAPLNSGVTISTPPIVDDIDGNTRTAPTMGAHEVIICTLNPITGVTNVCMPGTTALSTTSTTGTWSSDNTAIATIDASGTVTAVAAGSAIISYTDATCSVTTTVTVGTLPITGSASVCIGTPTTLSNGTPGGVWSSDNTAVAVVTGSGVVSGVAAGSANISYTFGSCPAVAHAITVSDPPSAISGVTSACVGTMTALSNTSGGGVWSSDNTAIATVSLIGDVTGAAAGSVNISYTVGSCATGIPVTIGTLPIIGTTTICQGATTQLTDNTSGGVWSTDNSAVATVSVTGLVQGGTNGTANISYTFGSCTAVSVAITVSAPPTAIAGAGSICAGSMLTLSSSPGGGSWSSANTAVATVTSTGDVTGVSGGTVLISYTLNSCTVTESVVVTAPLTPITGSMSLCTGQLSTLSNTTSGGVWSSSVTGIATITNTGDITAVGPGNTVITYAVGSCTTTATVTVSNPPSAITGPTVVCAGSSITLSDGVPGGSWTSGTTTVATISGTGVITTVGAGMTLISYSIGSCVETYSVTVDAALSPITGITGFCVGGTTTLNNITSGGTWSSSNTSVATVLPGAGDVTGVAAGTSGIIYTLGSCSVTTTVTVSTPPVAITGPTDVCESSTITLSDATPGGFWDSYDPTIAIVSSTGDVTGISAGTVIIDYSDGVCEATTTITVAAALGSITGTTSICAGGSTSLNNSSFGGSWTSTNTAVAVIDASGFVTSVGAGNTTIIYSLGPCSVSTVVTVSNPPAAITGPASVCVGSTITLNDATPGGVWTSSNVGVATVAGGTVGGVTAGLVTISYSLGGCVVGAAVTVNNALPAISGPTSVCVGSTITLSNPVPGGTWSGDNNPVATVSNSGVVSGVAPGTVNISYTGGGCSATAPITVNANSAGVISGQDSICIGAGHAVTLTSTVAGGVWSSSNAGRAVVDASGVVTGISSGVFTITYTVNNACGTFTATYAMYVRTASKCATGIDPDTENTVGDLNVFPNPNEGRFTVNLSSSVDEEVTVVVTNVVGAKVKELSGMTNRVLDIQLDPIPGIYIITASTEHGKYVRKIVLQ